MRLVATQRTYLEMLSPPAQLAVAAREGVEVNRLIAPDVAEYRQLYRAVGADYQWWDRLLMPDEELRQIVQDERVEVYVLSVGGEVAGYTELDRRSPGEIEIAYFGLVGNFIGRGLGKFLLQWTLARAWSYQPRRVWVHTCGLDHPAALPNYVKAGFAVCGQQIVEQRVMEN